MEANNYVISYEQLRRRIGYLGISLPFLCWGVNAFVNNYGLLNNLHLIDCTQSWHYTAGVSLKSSISHFYYTAAGPLFTGILITVAVFLFCYVGYPMKKEDDKFWWLTDNRVANFAGFCALGIVVFPTGSDKLITDNIHFFVSSKIAGNLHFGFATLFFLSIAVMCIINFRRHPGKVFIKTGRGTLYLICGWGIIACLVIAGVVVFAFNNAAWVPRIFIFSVEVLMLAFFSTAWLAKGKSTATEYVLKAVEKKSP